MSDQPPLPQTGKIADYGSIAIEHVAREVSGLRVDIGELVKLVRDELKPAISGLADRVSRIEVRLEDRDARDAAVDRELAQIRVELAELRDAQPSARRRRAAAGKPAKKPRASRRK